MDYLCQLDRVFAGDLQANRRWTIAALTVLIGTVAGEFAAPTPITTAGIAGAGLLLFLFFWTHAGVRLNVTYGRRDQRRAGRGNPVQLRERVARAPPLLRQLVVLTGGVVVVSVMLIG